MLPGLQPGSYALFRRSRGYGVGQTVLVDHPQFGRIVKRISDVSEQGVSLHGTSQFSTSSEALGVVPSSTLMGRLVWVSPPRLAKTARDTPETQFPSSSF